MALGRPKLKESERREYQLRVHLSANEKARTEEKASARGQTLSRFGREAVLRQKMPVPVVDKDSYTALQKIGGNLNQLMRAIHQGYNVDPERVEAALKDIRELVKRITG